MNDSTNLAESLRQLADILDAHPDMTKPNVDVRWHLWSATAKEEAAAIRRAVPAGRWRKLENGDTFWLSARLGDISLTTFIDREQVCERVVTVETVTIPAEPALPAQPERTVTREVVEWRCDPVLLDATEQQPAGATA